MKKIISLFVFFQFIFLPCFGQVVINEVMYNNGGNEWVELYNSTDNNVNLSDWKIGDENSNDTLSNLMIPHQSYALIVDNSTVINGSYGCNAFDEVNCMELTAIGSGLNNNGGDTVYLYNNSENLTDSVTYNDSWGADGDGNSLQRINSSQNLSNNLTNWVGFPPSPGKQNFYENATLELLDISAEEIYVNETTTIFVKIANRGIRNATNISVNLSINNTYNDSGIINITGINISEIQFNWTPNQTGNYTIFAYLKNETISKNIFVLPPLQKNATLAMYIEDTILLDIEYTSLFKIEIENKKEIKGNCSGKDNITVQYNITNLTGELIKENNFTVEVGCSKWANTGNWIPNQIGNFTVCGRIINATTTYNETRVCNNISVIQNPIEILSKPESVSFGSLNFVLFKFEVNNFSADYFGLNNMDLKFVVYTPSGEGGYIIKDFYENTIYASEGCNSDFSLEVKNVSENFSAYIFLPFYITANCNDYYDEGSYLSKIRMFKLENGNCSSSSSNHYDISEFEININGKNQSLCPNCPKPSSSKKEETKEKTKREKSKTLEIEILNLTKEVARNEEFTTRVKLKNNFGKKISFETYSYAFDGRNCITGGWTSNRKEVTLEENEEKTIKLRNKIEEETKPGDYPFRVRAKLDDDQIDKTKNIKVNEEIIKEAAQVKEFKLPNLKIWNDTKIRMNLSNCEGCKMIITGPNITAITNRKYRVFDRFGKYKVFVLKNSKVLINKTYVWESKKEPRIINQSEEKQSSNNTSTREDKFTGKFREKNIFESIVENLNYFYSYILDLMKNSINNP